MVAMKVLVVNSLREGAALVRLGLLAALSLILHPHLDFLPLRRHSGTNRAADLVELRGTLISTIGPTDRMWPRCTRIVPLSMGGSDGET